MARALDSQRCVRGRARDPLGRGAARQRRAHGACVAERVDLHRERRQVFGERDAFLQRRLHCVSGVNVLTRPRGREDGRRTRGRGEATRRRKKTKKKKE